MHIAVPVEDNVGRCTSPSAINSATERRLDRSGGVELTSTAAAVVVEGTTSDATSRATASGRAFHALQHDLDGTLSHEFDPRLLVATILNIVVFGVCVSAAPNAVWAAGFSNAAAVGVSCVPLLFTLLSLLWLDVPLYEYAVAPRLGSTAGRVLNRFLYSYLWFRPIWTWVPPYLMGAWSQGSHFRKEAANTLLTHSTRKIAQMKKKAQDEIKSMRSKMNKRPGLREGPLVALSPEKNRPSLPFLLLHDADEVMLHANFEVEEYDLASSGGYKSDEMSISARPLFAYRSVLENGVLVRSLSIAWLLLGILSPLLVSYVASIGCTPWPAWERPAWCTEQSEPLRLGVNGCCVELRQSIIPYTWFNTALIALSLASALLTATAGFWPSFNTAAVFRRSLDATCERLPLVRWMRAQSLEYERVRRRLTCHADGSIDCAMCLCAHVVFAFFLALLSPLFQLTIKKQPDFQSKRLWVMFAFIGFGLVIVGAFLLGTHKSTLPPDFSVAIQSVRFWISLLLLTGILCTCCGVIGEFVLMEYHIVVVSSQLRLAYFTALLRPKAALQQLADMKRYAQRAIRRHESYATTVAGKKMYDNLMPVEEARIFLSQLNACKTPTARMQLVLRSWLEARMFVQRFDSNFQMEGASWLIGVLVLFTAGALLYFLLVGFILARGNLLADPSISLMLVMAVGCALLSLIEVLAILRSFVTTQEQKKRIELLPLELCYQCVDEQEAESSEAEVEEEEKEPHPRTFAAAAAEESVSKDEQPSKSDDEPSMKDFLADFATLFSAQDAAPTVLGFAVTPAFLQVLQGYLITAASTVGAALAAKFE